MTVNIRVADHAGACYGVERALKLARRCGAEARPPSTP